jgi:enoyl-CoA hydratase
VIAGLNSAFDGLHSDVHAVIITSAGEKFFAAGADITEFVHLDGGSLISGQIISAKIENLPLAVIAAINGIAYGGGCELAMSCDMRIASTTAKFGQPEINLGIIPGWGGTQRLPRLIGRGRALEMMLIGDPIDAPTALSWGLVNRVVEPGELLAEAKAMAMKLASKAPLAIAATKKAVNSGLDRPMEAALRAESEAFERTFHSEDAREGVTAFLEKRQPTWQGK